MSEQAKETARRYLEIIAGKGDLSSLEVFVAPDCVWHLAVEQEPVHGIQQHREHLAGYVGLLGNINIHVEDAIAEGDRVAARWVAHPETFDQKVSGMTFFRFADGKIAEVWSTWDTLVIHQSTDESDFMGDLTVSL